MKKKYYTPNASEFHIGFEYEVFDYLKNKWDKITLGVPNHFELDQLNEVIECPKKSFSKTFRVKYLDKKDIESLEYENRMKRLPEKYNQYFTKNYKCKRNYYNYIHVLTNDLNNHVLIVASINLDSAKGDTLFTGIIKNKSELKIILKQVT